jgi:hypothetical protein
MKDGANQEIKVGTFCIFTEQNTATMSLGFIIGFTANGVQIRGNYTLPTRKTSLRVIQVSDELAESMDKNFFNKNREEFPVE